MTTPPTDARPDLDTRTLDLDTYADRQVLRRMVAEQAGWRIRSFDPAIRRYKDLPSYPQDQLDKTETKYCIRVPDDVHSSADEYTYNTEAEAAAWLPEFESDYNQTFWLLSNRVSDDYTPRLVRILTPLNGEIEHWWKCTIMPNTGGEEFEATHADPAIAVCLAWLSYATPTSPAGDGAGIDNGGDV